MATRGGDTFQLILFLKILTNRPTNIGDQEENLPDYPFPSYEEAPESLRANLAHPNSLTFSYSTKTMRLKVAYLPYL